MQQFNPIIEDVTECVRRECHSTAGTDRRKNSGPAVVLLHDARFIIHPRENRSDVFLVASVLLGYQSDEWFAGCVSQRNGLAPREPMVARNRKRNTCSR